ncbi:Uncharacterised protein [Serratia rubidaea]|uniref:Uncharacterized protein n=1 Tax=Serratia rubidaea TaxID=61652 RepID=A0A3S4GFV3_SERRU|nr:Uncharacterised protein [Serratia rubidaea]
MIFLLAIILGLLAWPALGYVAALLMAANYIIIIFIVRFIENRKREEIDGWDGYE